VCGTRLAENAGPKKVAKNRHVVTIAQLCRAISSQPRHISTIGKKLLSSNTSSRCPHNMVNIGPLTAEIGWRVWGTPTDFNGFRVLAALLHGALVLSVSQTLRRWTEGATYVRQGDHHVGHWPTFLVSFIFFCNFGEYRWIYNHHHQFICSRVNGPRQGVPKCAIVHENQNSDLHALLDLGGVMLKLQTGPHTLSAIGSHVSLHCVAGSISRDIVTTIQ